MRHYIYVPFRPAPPGAGKTLVPDGTARSGPFGTAMPGGPPPPAAPPGGGTPNR